MSDAVSPLNGAVFDGFVTVAALDSPGMITLRGDLESEVVTTAARRAAGVEMPAPGRCGFDGESGLAWMAPDELLIFMPRAEVSNRLERLHADLEGTHFLAVDVSDARAMFRLDGAGAREVIAKLCPVDMSPEAFAPGMFRRTRMAQIAAALWMPQAGAMNIICFRSVAEYAFNLLRDAAAPGGEVGIHS